MVIERSKPVKKKMRQYAGQGRQDIPAAWPRWVPTKQLRGQLWFQLEQMCNDFKVFSGLPEKRALEVLVAVLSNMRTQQQGELDRLTGESGSPLA
jgi:hypothetical protein